MPGIIKERNFHHQASGRRVTLTSRSRSQIRSHTLHMPSADVEDWTSYRDSRNRCTRQPGALYNLDKVEVRKWQTWFTVPFIGRLALARGKTQTCGGHRRDFGPSPARKCRSLKNAGWVVSMLNVSSPIEYLPAALLTQGCRRSTPTS